MKPAELLSLVVVFVCLLSASRLAAQPAQNEPAGDAAEAGSFIQNHPARPLYLRHCAGCHGQDLQGGNASSFLDGQWSFGAGRGEVDRSIRHGISGYGMPNFGDALSNDEIRSLVEYIREAPRKLGLDSSTTPDTLQTRDYDVRVELVVNEGLQEPWAIAFIDERRALVTDKPGQLYWLIDGKLDPNPIRGTPNVLHAGQGGLLDVNVDPRYGDGENDWVYLSFSHPLAGDDGPAMTKVVRGRIVDGQWTDEQTLFQARDEDYVNTRYHYGSRIVFDDKGDLYFSIGDRGVQDRAQELTRPNGKIHRIRRDGAVPSDNPFVDGDGGNYDSIYSFGHRNPQGMAIHPETGALWLTEHGPMGGDELNHVVPGRNYGWPVITYGLNYNGTIITDQFKQPGMEQPAAYWVPSIAVCGLDAYSDGPFERWRGNLFAGALAHEEVRRIVIDGDRAIHQEVILKSVGRVRDVCCAPDGSIYVLLNRPGRILRLSYLDRALRQ